MPNDPSETNEPNEGPAYIYPPPPIGEYSAATGSLTPEQKSEVASKKLAAGLTAILLGSLGVHKFVMGYTKEGLITLAISLVTCGIAAPVMHIIGIIEGIIYLTKSDEEYYAMYIAQKKAWF